jgi:transcriptional regulator with XRE-family HTH domain
MSNDNIGNRIKNVRKVLALQQTEFAKEIGISQSTISSYEKNLRNPPVSVLKQIADIYNINLDYLLNDEEPILLNEKVENLKLPSDKAKFFDEFCKVYNLDECSKKIIQEYLLLPQNQRHIVNKFFKIIKDIK